MRLPVKVPLLILHDNLQRHQYSCSIMKLCLQCNYLLGCGGPSDTEEMSYYLQCTEPSDSDPIVVSHNQREKSIK